jgi:predicted naringenin-chalcone synthase
MLPVLFIRLTAFDLLLCGAGVSAGDIDILVTACGVYCPTPSMSAALVNKLGMGPDVITYSLGGMGCSSGVLGVQLINELLQVGLQLAAAAGIAITPDAIALAIYELVKLWVARSTGSVGV